jgi:arsenate reductase (thioredoxin)
MPSAKQEKVRIVARLRACEQCHKIVITPSLVAVSIWRSILPYNILVLCTGNSARSILGEAILQRLGRGRIQAYSAGSQPKAEPNPFALELLCQEGYAKDQFASKSWDVFSKPESPKIDLVITVCDSADGEACPVFLGAPLRCHWGLKDPVAVTGTKTQKQAAFRKTYNELMHRATALVALPFETMPKDAFQIELKRIGSMQGATARAKNYAAMK